VGQFERGTDDLSQSETLRTSRGRKVAQNERLLLLSSIANRIQRPFQNPTNYAGMDRERLEKMEDRLCEDVLREARMLAGNVLVHEEVSNSQCAPLTLKTNLTTKGVKERTIRHMWEAIGSEAIVPILSPMLSPNLHRKDGGRRVTTPKGLFNRLREKEGLTIKYLRLPTTPEQVI